MIASTAPESGSGSLPARLARAALLLYVFLLPFMRPALPLLGYEAVAADAAFLLLVPLWGLALLSGAARLRWHPALWLLAAYLAAMALSLLGALDPARGAAKLATQIYLLSLPLAALSLLQSERDVRALFAAWLAATALVALLALASVAAFIVDSSNPFARWGINDFGTLPPGGYPRLRLTFLYAAMLCNYLGVSLMLLLVARRLGWIARSLFLPLVGGILFAAAFSLTPGLGGLFLVGGAWIWLLLREDRPALARAALAAGIAAALLFVAAMAATPFLHPTAPFLIAVPGSDVALAPSVRLMAWLEAAANFAADPLLGRGIGADTVDVRIQLPSGELAGVTDAHNVFLNVAVQCGAIGLVAVLALVGWVALRLCPLRLAAAGDALRVGLALAFLGAFAWQGLGGAFEDARHLWLLFGLILAADRLAADARRERAAPAGTALFD